MIRNSSFVLAALVLVNCSKSIEVPEKKPTEARPQVALALAGSLGCSLDGDCDKGLGCFQGRCASAMIPAPAGESNDVALGLSIVGRPDRVHRIKSLQRTVRVELTLSGNVPATGLGFLVERSDRENNTPTVQYQPGTGSKVVFELPVGNASPDVAEHELVSINLVTQAGSVRFNLLPELSQDGRYQGTFVTGTFGQNGLPIGFSIVTDPAGSSLQSATAAYLVLPVESGNLFSPTSSAADGGGPTFVTRPLIWDDFVRAWVATAELPYPLEATSPLGWVASADNAVSRNMRFELNVEDDGSVVGRLSDRWSGIFEERSAAGVLEPADIVYEGELSLIRADEAPELSTVTPPAVFTRPAAGRLPLPSITACANVMFPAAVVAADGGVAQQNCSTVTTQAQFIAATPDVQAKCALAIADRAMAGNTTSGTITAFIDDSIPDPNGQSFAAFMQDCAAQTNGTCVPSNAVLCARQLSARALKSSGEGSADAVLLLKAYQATTREAFLGRQFAAFYADAQTRLTWLKSTDYPAIVTATVKTHLAGLLSSWKGQVLDAHAAVLSGTFDSAGGAVLGQEISDASALNAQRSLLMESTQTWRGAADALALGATRYDTLLSDANARAVQTTSFYARAVDLYLGAGLLAELNRKAGAGANNAVFAGGFGPVLMQTARLAQPYDRLIYDRQGEVVISTSLDPMSTNDTVLASRKAAALLEIDKADTAVADVIARAQTELLKQAELTAKLSGELGSLRSELAELCGLPAGCAVPNSTTCKVRTEAGKCGFVLSSAGDVENSLPNDANISQAGASLLDIRAASLGYQRAQEAEQTHALKLQLQGATVEAFATQVQKWNTNRLATVRQISTQVATLKSSRDTTLAALGANLEMQATARDARLVEEGAFVSTWYTTETNGISDDIRAMKEIGYAKSTAEGLRSAAGAIDTKVNAMAEGLPKGLDDGTSWGRMALKLSGFYAGQIFKVGAVAADSAAAYLDRELQRQSAMRDAELKTLELSNDLANGVVEAEVDDLRNKAALITTASELEQGVVRQVIALLEAESAAALAYDRDLVELRDRRDDLYGKVLDQQGLRIETMQAEFGILQAVRAYNQVVQRSQLLEGRLAQVEIQAANVNTIVGSPSVVFAWANRLSRAEERLERAKKAVMDWVVALEYFAVRPFFDQRIQILLARNTTQLEAIAAQLTRLQGSCGGAVNNQTVELSLRDDLLGLTSPTKNLQTGEDVTPVERFRNELTAARIPVDKRIRYKSDSTVGDLLNRSGIFAATFSFDMDTFANLSNVCNAKVASVSIQLVGEGLGTARPTVTVLYDGTSQLRSCQPDIKQIVETIGPTQTSFAEITQFKAKGRSISPIASINEFGAEGNENKSLGGLPLVSQYTVLIDPRAGENSRIAWNKLEDVKLKVNYGYQDLFPAGQCQ